MAAAKQLAPAEVLKQQEPLPRGARVPCQAPTFYRGQALVAAAAIAKLLMQLPSDPVSFAAFSFERTK